MAAHFNLSVSHASLCVMVCPSSLSSLSLFLSEDAAGISFLFYLIGHSLHLQGWPQDGGRAEILISLETDLHWRNRCFALVKKRTVKVRNPGKETFTAELAFPAGVVTVCVSPLRWRKAEFPLTSAARGAGPGQREARRCFSTITCCCLFKCCSLTH